MGFIDHTFQVMQNPIQSNPIQDNTGKLGGQGVLRNGTTFDPLLHLRYQEKSLDTLSN